MSTITKTLAELPTPPSRADIANFDTRADEFLAALPAMADDINTVTGQINTVAGEVNAANVAAQSAKTTAQSAQAAAQAAASASAWSSATAYTVGQVVFGLNGHSYRALAVNTNVNPVTDASGKWLRLTLGLGTTASDAFPGDKGQLADTHRQSPHAPSNAQKNSDITKEEIEAKLVGQIGSHSHAPEGVVLVDNGHNNVGSPCFAINTSGIAINPGGVIAGSSLRACGVGTINGVMALDAEPVLSLGSLSGTWRCLGKSTGGVNILFATFWQKIAA